MTEIYRDGSLGKVAHYAERLRAEGIEIFVRNENLSITEVQIPAFYPALCVLNEEDLSPALKFLQAFKEEEKRPLGPDWKCSQCGEDVPDSMSECWSCQAPRV